MSAVSFDQTIGERQGATYMARWRKPSVKNRGPKGTSLVGKGAYKHYFVVVDQPAPAGTVCAGRVYPEGTILRGVPIVPLLHSRRQARKALARVRKKMPHAYRLTYTTQRDSRCVPTSVRLPDGVHWHELPLAA